MSEVAAISGATGEDLQKLTDKAKEMGAKTKFSATESAEAFKYMAMAGWKTGDMLNGIEGIMNLAAASGENLGSVSDIVTDALTALGYSAKDSAHFADVLAAASSNSNTNVGMMGETFKYAAPLAGALGYDMEDLAMSIGLMANAGIKSSQAGTSLRALFTRLAKPTKEVDKAMTKYGISLTKSGGEMKSLREVMENMRTSLQGLPADEQTAAAAAIAGQEAMTGLLAIINASDDDWDKLSKAIDNCNGSAEDMAKTMLDNLPGAVIIAKSALVGLGNAIYETYSEKAKVAVQDFTLFLNELTEAVQKRDIPGIINVIGDGLDSLITKIGEKGPGVIAKVSDVAGQVLDKLNEIAPNAVNAGAAIFDSLQQGLMDNLPKIREFAAQVGPTLLAFFVEHKADMLLLGLTVLQGITEGLANNPDLISQTITDVVTQIGTFLTDSAPTFIQNGLDVLANIVKGISDNAEKVSDGLTAVITAITSWIAEPGNLSSLISSAMNIVKTLAQGLAENAASIGEGLADVIVAVVDWIAEPGNLASLLNAAIDIIAKLAEGLTEHAEEIGTGIADIIAAIVNWLSDPGNLLSVVAAAFEITAALLKGLISPESLAKMAEAAETLINSLIESIKSWGSTVIASIQSWWDGILAGLGLKATAVVDVEYRTFGGGATGGAGGGGSIDAKLAQRSAVKATPKRRNATVQPYASGIDYVPYDNYLAALHRGEAVVPKNEAERERSAAIDPAAIASAVADAVVSALSGMAVQMDGQQVGELVAPAVSAALGATVNRQKRYSGVFA